MVVSESPVDDSVVYLTEVWTSEGAWERAERSPAISAWAKGMSALVAEEPESIRLAPIGGKGLQLTHAAEISLTPNVSPKP
jgi:quinol monooxygenase YgiN